MRYICPFHAEKTPSLVIYPTGYVCYGCGKKGKLKELPENLQKEGQHVTEHEPEDLTERFRYIDALPREYIRGLEFPADDRGYFVCGVDRNYYKYRLFNPGKGSKYIGPKGHSTPLFWAERKRKNTLCIVEGEINALSVARVMREWDVCSPGSASNFNTNNLSKYLTQFTQYANIVVVLDNDPAGIKALIETRATFLYKLPFVRYLQMDCDANEVLIVEGEEGLRGRLQGEDGQLAPRNIL